MEGEPAKIAFNSKYLQDVLQILDSGQVALETTSPSSPGVLRPLGIDNLRARCHADVCAMVVISASFGEANYSLDHNAALSGLNFYSEG